MAAALVPVDAEVRLAGVDGRLVRELGSLGPFGQAHEAPTLMTSSVKVLEARRVGDGTHLKLTLVDGDDTRRGGIGFGLGASEVMTGDRVDVVYGPMLSRWQGRSRVELELRAVAIQRAPE